MVATFQIWLRASPDHKLIICRNWKTRDKRKMLVKVTFVQVQVLLLLGSENYSGTKILWAVMPVWVRIPLGVLLKYK